MLAGFSTGVIIWTYRQGWGQTLWHLCQSTMNNLAQHFPLVWQFVTLALFIAAVCRGSWRLGQQLKQTRRFVAAFRPHRVPPPPRVRDLLRMLGVSPERVVYLDMAPAHAFSLGFLYPQIWLTAGLVNLLTPRELAAVLAHEAHHCRRRDPLRLLVSRTLETAFFFLLPVKKLAQTVELELENAADRSAIRQMGDDLPLLSALQKLLTLDGGKKMGRHIPLAPLNVTEARLRRLVGAPKPAPARRKYALARAVADVGAVLLFVSIGFLSTRPIAAHQQITTCTLDEAAYSRQISLPLTSWTAGYR